MIPESTLFATRPATWPAVAYLLLVIVTFSTVSYAQQQSDHELEPIVVTASRIPTTLSDSARSVLVLQRDDIERAPVHSVPDLLGYASGLDLRRRGPHGVQAEASIRGGSFDQTLILIDGIKVNDPQTGHHNLDLPLTLDDIDRVEILKGPGSRLYGPDAFGGVINIITRKEEKKAAFSGTVGEHEFARGSLSLSYPLNGTRNRLSLSKTSSAGYTDATDFDILNIFYGTTLKIGLQEIDFTYGYTDKEFGADSFYSDLFPNEWEQTRTRFLAAAGDFVHDNISFCPKLHWRRHWDDFILDRARPQWFRNRHRTDLYGMEIQATINETRWGSFASGGELLRDTIESSNLGDHARTRGGLFFEYRLETDKSVFVPGLALRYCADWGWRGWPGVDLGYQATEMLRFFASVGRSFRIPSYTELYYDSPANKGNPDLTLEKAWAYEAGLKLGDANFFGNLSLFRREGSELIDWVRTGPTGLWEARNISEVDTDGLEVALTFHPQGRFHLSRVHAGYTFLDSDKKTEAFTSKYVLDYLKHHFILDIHHNLPWHFQGSWKLQWKDRVGHGSYFLADAKISRSFKYVGFFVQATNLFDRDYTEVPGVPMPGRWLTAGVKIDLASGG